MLLAGRGALRGGERGSSEGGVRWNQSDRQRGVHLGQGLTHSLTDLLCSEVMASYCEQGGCGG